MNETHVGESKIVLGNNLDCTGDFEINFSTLEQAELATYSNIHISFGTAIVSVEPEASAEKLLLSKDFVKRLVLPDFKNLGKKINGNHIILGPLIGVFVSELDIENLKQGHCRNTNFYKYSHVCQELNGICCFFSIKDISWEQRLIKGWVLQSDKELNEQWISREFPFPTVVYDRSFGPRAQAHGYELREGLAAIPSVVVFNAMPKLRKLETHQLLKNNSKLKNCLPETLKYSPQGLLETLERLTRVYIKPDGLSKGQGVFRVSGKCRNLLVEYRDSDWNQAVQLDNIDQLEEMLEPFCQRGGGYIIQQEIPLAKYKGNQFDMRVLCQKDITGKWGLSGIAVRIAAPGSVITSPRSGGFVTNWHDALETVFKQCEDTPVGVASKVEEVAMEICRTVEKRHGICGELGLDLGLDNDGNVWIIEVNGKPLKVSLQRLHNSELTETVYTNPIKFAYYLACRPNVGVR
jgi:hypothetical protein